MDAAQKSRKDKALEAAVMTEVGVWKICKGFFLRFIGPTRATSISAGGCTRSTTRGPGPGVGDRQATTADAVSSYSTWHGADIWS